MRRQLQQGWLIQANFLDSLYSPTNNCSLFSLYSLLSFRALILQVLIASLCSFVLSWAQTCYIVCSGCDSAYINSNYTDIIMFHQVHINMCSSLPTPCHCLFFSTSYSQFTSMYLSNNTLTDICICLFVIFSAEFSLGKGNNSTSKLSVLQKGRGHYFPCLSLDVKVQGWRDT